MKSKICTHCFSAHHWDLQVVIHVSVVTAWFHKAILPNMARHTTSPHSHIQYAPERQAISQNIDDNFYWCDNEIKDIILVIISANLNTLWPSNTIWWYRTGSTMAQAMARCLMAPSHYLKQCWLNDHESCFFLWHSSTPLEVLRNLVLRNLIHSMCLHGHDTLKITPSPRGQWVQKLSLKDW